jgi:hypothetical protein
MLSDTSMKEVISMQKRDFRKSVNSNKNEERVILDGGGSMSDKRLKKEIVSIKGGLEKIKNLSLFTRDA